MFGFTWLFPKRKNSSYIRPSIFTTRVIRSWNAIVMESLWELNFELHLWEMLHEETPFFRFHWEEFTTHVRVVMFGGLSWEKLDFDSMLFGGHVLYFEMLPGITYNFSRIMEWSFWEVMMVASSRNFESVHCVIREGSTIACALVQVSAFDTLGTKKNGEGLGWGCFLSEEIVV